MTHYENFVNGKFTPSNGKDRIIVLNPANGQPLATVPDSTASDVDTALSAAKAAQKEWAKRPSVQRALALRAIASSIREQVEPLARIITEEQGKILALARVEVAFTADYLDYMAEWARRIEGEILESDRPGEAIFLFRQPIGVIGGILPWNFPFFLIARKAAPALITGNTIVIKPSEETPHNAVQVLRTLAQIEACPPGVINIVHGRGATAGKALASSSPASAWSASPAAWKPAPPSWPQPRPTSPRSTSNWAAKPPPSSWRTPISILRYEPLKLRASSIAARCATAPNASMCRATSPISSWKS